MYACLCVSVCACVHVFIVHGVECVCTRVFKYVCLDTTKSRKKIKFIGELGILGDVIFTWAHRMGQNMKFDGWKL